VGLALGAVKCPIAGDVPGDGFSGLALRTFPVLLFGLLGHYIGYSLGCPLGGYPDAVLADHLVGDVLGEFIEITHFFLLIYLDSNDIIKKMKTKKCFKPEEINACLKDNNESAFLAYLGTPAKHPMCHPWIDEEGGLTNFFWDAILEFLEPINKNIH